MKKSLFSVPKRLQRMLLRLQKFDLDVSYRKGTEMHMADPLSRAYLPLVKQDIVDTLEVWTVADTRSLTEVEIESIPIQKLTFQEIKRANEVDAELQELAPIIAQGWSEKWVEVPSQLQDCFPFREELAIQNGVVFKDKRFVVSSSLRQCMMDKVHASHLGIQGCLRRAKEAFSWLGI